MTLIGNTKGVEVELHDESTDCVSTITASILTSDDELSSVQVLAPTRMERRFQEGAGCSTMQHKTIQGHQSAGSIINDLNKIPKKSHKNRDKHTNHQERGGKKREQKENQQDKKLKSKQKFSATMMYTGGREGDDFESKTQEENDTRQDQEVKRKSKLSTAILEKLPSIPNIAKEKLACIGGKVGNVLQNKESKSKSRLSSTKMYTDNKQTNDLEAQKIRIDGKHPPKHTASEDNADSWMKHIWGKNFAKITIFIALYCIIATIICGWLIKEMSRIPGLNQEIDDLSEQIYKLQLEIDGLNGEVKRLENQVDRLEKTNDDLKETKEKLEEENMIAKENVAQLQEMNTEFGQLNDELKNENDRYFDYTQELNVTVNQLVNELAVSKKSRQELTVSLDQYKALRDTLELEIASLSDTAGTLNSTVKELDDAIKEFEEENNRFRTIVSFLEEEANGVQHSYDELARMLEETILRKRALAEIGVKERMKSELAGWECGIVTAFGTHEFSKNVDYPIGDTHYGKVMDYANDKILSDFCIDKIDLESYLKDVILGGASIWTISLSEFTRGVNLYTSAVFNYFFPDEGDTDGLAQEEWEEANYDCNNLSHKFSFN